MNLSTYIAQQPGETENAKRRILQDSFLREGVRVSRAANLQEDDESSYFKLCFGLEKETLLKGLGRCIPEFLRAKGRLAKVLKLYHDSAETPVNEEQVRPDQLAEDLVKRLLEEHDRSHPLRAVGITSSPNQSSGEQEATKRTNRRVARKKREFVLTGKPDKLELHGTQPPLNGGQREERELEL